eukprot:jgi/Botrbrau1/17383/Bobra.0491s0004.1
MHNHRSEGLEANETVNCTYALSEAVPVNMKWCSSLTAAGRQSDTKAVVANNSSANACKVDGPQTRIQAKQPKSYNVQYPDELSQRCGP